MHIVTSGPRPCLLVVDWRSHTPQALRRRLEKAQAALSASNDRATGPWVAVNAHDLAQPWGLRMAWDYLRTAVWVWWHGRDFARVVVWQPRMALILALLPRRAKAAPWVVTSVLWSSRPGGSVGAWCRRAAVRGLLQRSDGVVFFSEELAQQAREAWPALAHKVWFQPMPVVPDEGDDDGLLNDLAADPQSPAQAHEPGVTDRPVDGAYIFAGGRSDRDLDIVVRALADAPWPTVIVCGAAQELPAQVQGSAKLRVVRDVDEARFGRWARGARLLLVTLRDAQSPCGQLLIAQGLAQGVPVIATDAFGPRALIRAGVEGVLVPAGDALALRQACERLWPDSPVRQGLIERGRLRAAVCGLPGFLAAMASLDLSKSSASSRLKPPPAPAPRNA